MDKNAARALIEAGQAVLGIEFGSTRIKAVLVDGQGYTLAVGTHDWENRLENGIWTYSLEDIHEGLQGCYASLKAQVQAQYGVTLQKLAAAGISAMMHGYLAFDRDGTLLVPFRTWRNTCTGPAAEKLSEVLDFHMPLRWTSAHLYQAVLNGEEHVKRLDHVTTLEGYVHWQLTGRKVLGVGEGSGVFPLDGDKPQYDPERMAKYEALFAPYNLPWKAADLLPPLLPAGAEAGRLTEAGAKLLDPAGDLEPGVPFCPPEGDAGTGMVATNCVAPGTGNVSAGTSVFAMIVLEKALSKVYPQLDIVATPTGKPVAMVHCNNCTSDLNAWVGLFGEFAELMGLKLDANTLYGTLYRKALEGDKDCAGLLAYNFYSGEHNVGLEEGRPLFVRTPEAKLTLANFMRTHLTASLAVLKNGMDLLLRDEKVEIRKILGHGGLFKTRGVGQSLLAAAINAPVTVMETAGEGGAWGIALLAAYMIHGQGRTLEEYMDQDIFAGMPSETLAPDPADVAGYDAFMQRYMPGLAIERAAVEQMKE